MPTFPPLVVSGQIIAAAHINAIRNSIVSAYGEIYAWTVDVAAANHSLTGVATLSATTATISGAISGASLSVTGSVGIGGAAAANVSLDLKAGKVIELLRPNEGSQFRVGYTKNDLKLRWLFNSTANTEVGVAALTSMGIVEATGLRITSAIDDANYYDFTRDVATGHCIAAGTQASFSGFEFWTKNAAGTSLRGLTISAGSGNGTLVAVEGSAWNGSHFVMGPYHLWADSSGRLRMKNGVPTSDTDGASVGSQS